MSICSCTWCGMRGQWTHVGDRKPSRAYSTHTATFAAAAAAADDDDDAVLLLLLQPLLLHLLLQLSLLLFLLLPSKELFEKRALLFPVFLGGNHWQLLVLLRPSALLRLGKCHAKPSVYSMAVG